MIICGIDPGLSGGVAIITQREIRHGFRMPVMTDLFGKKNKMVIDVTALAAELVNSPVDMVVIERVHAMPGQGVTSMFSFGLAYGQAMAVAMVRASGGGSVVQITPQVWKRHFGLKGSSKRDSILVAKDVFGDTYRWKYQADNGIAEAALMAQCYLDKTGEM